MYLKTKGAKPKEVDKLITGLYKITSKPMIQSAFRKFAAIIEKRAAKIKRLIQEKKGGLDDSYLECVEWAENLKSIYLNKR